MLGSPTNHATESTVEGRFRIFFFLPLCSSSFSKHFSFFLFAFSHKANSASIRIFILYLFPFSFFYCLLELKTESAWCISSPLSKSFNYLTWFWCIYCRVSFHLQCVFPFPNVVLTSQGYSFLCLSKHILFDWYGWCVNLFVCEEPKYSLGL